MPGVLGKTAPPAFLGMAAHPLRWRLLTELAHSDRRVGELCSLLGCPQSLVSYHLARLRSASMVSCRRSSADGRDSYYSINLGRCAELLIASGGALHPGLRLAPPLRPPSGATGRPPVRVLFSCTGNSARSQIAEALAEQLGDGAIDPVSAGSHPKPLPPNAVRVMREHGIDLTGRRSKPLSEFAGQRFAYVVTLCDRVREVCPEFSGHPGRVHWSIPDPARQGNTDDETYPAFQRTATELVARVGFLVDVIEQANRTQEAS